MSSEEEALLQYVNRASGRDSDWHCRWGQLVFWVLWKCEWTQCFSLRKIKPMESVILPSDMLLSTCKKHMRRLLISAWSSLSHRSRVLPRVEASWFWGTEEESQAQTDKHMKRSGLLSTESVFIPKKKRRAFSKTISKSFEILLYGSLPLIKVKENWALEFVGRGKKNNRTERFTVSFYDIISTVYWRPEITVVKLHKWSHSLKPVQGSTSGGQTDGGIILPAVAESREKTAVEQQLHRSKGLATYQAGSSASNESRPWNWGWLHGKHEAMALAFWRVFCMEEGFKAKVGFTEKMDWHCEAAVRLFLINQSAVFKVLS